LRAEAISRTHNGGIFNPEHEAEAQVKVMLASMGDVRSGLIPLSDYADENTFNFLVVKPGWTFAEWRAVNLSVARQLQDHGFTVRLVRLELNEFFDFLARYNHLSNTPQNRAQFVAWKIAQEDTKPQPL
jgi:hypothetical protein